MNYNQTKADFLVNERNILEHWLKLSNEWGLKFRKLNIKVTYPEFCALFYAEAATQPNGTLDTQSTHSLGERGILPLPQALEFWLDETPQALEFWLDETPIIENPGTNILIFMRYLVAIKNNPGTPYTHHFENIGELESIDLLAAIVHGYLYGPNFDPPSFPQQSIVDRIVESPEIGSCYRFIEQLGYKNVHTLASRSENLQTGIALANPNSEEPTPAPEELDLTLEQRIQNIETRLEELERTALPPARDAGEILLG